MFLLRLKNWQAFLLLFILPFILRYALTILLDTTGLASSETLTILVDALPSIVPLLWLWRLGSYLYHRLPTTIKISPAYFHLGSLYFVLYVFLLIYTLGIVRESVTEGTLPLGMLALLLPMHLFATFCYLYLVYFVARSIVSVEKQHIVAFQEYVWVLVQTFFLPIGIWFLQPRLGKLTTEASIH